MGVPYVLYPKDAAEYRPTAIPLLLTNKQLHAETSSTLSRLFGQNAAYEIHVGIVKERYLAPTWISVPKLSETVDHVRAVIQTRGVLDAHKGTDFWKRGCGGPGRYVFAFLALLTRFLHRGPVGRRTSDEKRTITIRTLELDFVDPEEVDMLPPAGILENGFYEAIEYRYLPPEDGEREYKIIPPEWLCSAFDSDIMTSLTTSAIDYGDVLYRRVGKIVIKANGEERATFNLANMLREVKFRGEFGQHPRNTRVDFWINWMEETVEKRKNRMLGIVELEEEWKGKARKTAARMYASR